ncbi:uncharacterized protein J4E84_002805 [Alternaria hordeiaustralica]|uniref:uncharacterized protein n=1 Tax=Alternaria hordeiaustralica TaxID=1187925 RepID=UPI0020C43A32|nr:uncharacterized protein J4E84_002805 [Alternaria hordeiaustralica]KAI4694223.1 hypothetical protein J4E84_002805 [Alternaria hordeiaustralica]
MSGFLINQEPPTRLERFVQDTIDSSKGFFAYLFRGSCLEYWMLDPNGQAYTLFMMTLLGVSTWLLTPNQNSKTVVASKPEQDWPLSEVAEEMDIDGEGYPSDEHQPFTPRHLSFPREDTSIMRKLAPPGYHPVNAHIEGSPFRVRQPLGPRVRQSVPSVHQAPSPLNPRLSKAFSTRPLQRDNFSSLHKDTPIANKTLQETSRTDAPDIFEECKTQSPVVAHWSNEGGQRYDRATLRREVATKYLS